MMKTITLFITVLMVLNANLIFAQAGSLDNTFGGGGKVTTDFNPNGTQFGNSDNGKGVAIQSDGKIVVAGYSGDNFAVTRYNANGTLDITFSGDGKATANFGGVDEGYAVAIQPDGKIVVGGRTGASSNGQSDFAVARFNANGTLDNTFSGDGKVTTNIGGYDYIQSVAIQSNGKIVVAGYTTSLTNDIALVRYNANGTLNAAFGTGGIVITDFDQEQAYAVTIQTNGKIVVAGYTSFGAAPNDYADFLLLRYNANGTLDNTFSGNGWVTTNLGGINDLGQAVAIQSDGKMVVAGYTTAAGGAYDFAVARYTANGTLDNSFSGDGKVTTDFGVNDLASSVAIQSNGKIVVAGYTKISTDYDFALARYTTNGTPDNTFDGDGKLTTNFSTNTQYNLNSGDEGYSMAIQADGKIVVAGTSFTPFETDNFAVARYNGDAVSSPLTNVSALTVENKINKDKSPSIRLYPNPVADVLHVQGLNPSASTILITDISGRVFQKATTISSEYAIDVKMLPAGVYYVSIIENIKTTNLKFIKQ